MTVTTGGRGNTSREVSVSPCRSSSMTLSLRSTGVWPISSTTSMAVSCSMVWLMVAITPMFIMTLMTSVALTAIFCASSPTVMASPIATSRTTRAVGISNPCFASASLPIDRRRPSRDFFFLWRELTSPTICSSCRP